MIRRRIYTELLKRIQESPAVALLGPRQVGKTTMALQLAQSTPSLYLDLESERDKAKLSDPEEYLSSHEGKLIILDEVHRMPEIFQSLRGIIDQGRRNGRKSGMFLLLGSASIDLLKQSGETLAGRISFLELNPFDLSETGWKSNDSLWVRGGFPDSFQASNDLASLQWRRDFIKTYLERDINQFGSRIPAETLRRFWTMLAHVQGSILNAAELARSLAIDGKSVAKYLDLMVDLLLVRRLPSFQVNVGKRLIKAPKVYIRDSGIVHALLELPMIDSLLSHPVAGGSWEGWVIENIMGSLPTGGQGYFYRTSAGAEIDLLLEMSGGVRWGIEIKRSSAPRLSKGFHLSAQDLQLHRKLIIYSGQERFTVADGVEAMSLSMALQEIQSQ